MNLLQRIVGDKIEIVSAELEAIAAELGDLPLALHLAGNFLAQYGHRISPSQYVQQLQEQKPLEHLSLTGHGLIISPTGHELHIAQTFALSYEQLDATKETDVLAQALLGRAAFFAPEPIPYDLLLATLKLDMRDWQTAILAEDGLLRLLKLGLLKSEKLEALLLHRLVAEFAKYHAHETAEASVKEIVYLRARQLNEARDPTQLLAWQTHLRFIADASREQKDEQTARIYNELGQHFWQIGDFKEAQPYYEKALAIRQTIFGEEHAETAESLNNLGALLRDKGQLDDARSYFEILYRTLFKRVRSNLKKDGHEVSFYFIRD
jgi:tetratricopeptide (TPR) repeat protein